MPVNAPFDAIAESYDRDFTFSIVGKLQRAIVWKELDRHLAGKNDLNILELNCGTGEDAFHLAEKGHKVLATDQSGTMIALARKKLEQPVSLPHPPVFQQVSFEGLQDFIPPGKQFDLVFSDFAGLNCIDNKALEKLASDMYACLKPGGFFIAVFLGKKCLVEKLFFTLKGEKEKINRRLHSARARLSEGNFQETHYYSAGELEKIFHPFTLKKKMPVGFFIPPSYLDPILERAAFLVPLLKFAESGAGKIPALADYGDHCYLAFGK